MTPLGCVRRVRARAATARAARGLAECSGICAVALLTACARDSGTGPGPNRASVANVAAVPNALNALSLVVTFDATAIDSARVVCERADGVVTATPFVPVTSGPVRVPVVGLDAETAYRAKVEAFSAGKQVSTGAVEAVTGALPASLRAFRLTGVGGPSAGYTLVVPIAAPTDTVAYVIAFDSAGAIAWYRAFPNEGWTIEAKQQPNGHITVYLGRSYGWQPVAGRFVEVAPDGEIVRTFTVRSVPYTDPHELRFTMRGSAVAEVHLLGYRLERTDLSALGGPADTLLAVHVLERQTVGGQPVFMWDAGASCSTADWPRTIGFPSDLVHPSAFAIDRGGDYVVSLQAVNEVVKVDGRTGQVRWRFGGVRNDFRVLDDPLGGFRGQHSVQVLENGHLLLFDNRRGASPQLARAVEYAIDEQRMEARLVWEFRPSPAVESPIMGSVQRLANGNTTVGFAIPGRAMEVDASGRVVWDASLTRGGAPVQFYRAIRIASLYSYSAP
jgi:arylsulfotransferase ASST